MTRHPFLESFSRPLGPSPQDAKDQERIEAAKSEAYEAGYASGWEDAIASDKTSRMRVEAEFERNIQNVALTFAEAVTQVREELRAFLTAMIDQFFPALVPETMRDHVRAELLRIGEDLADTQVEIVSSPECHQIISDMLQADLSMNIVPLEDPSLSAGQVHVKLGPRETEIDLTTLMAAVSEQLKAMGERTHLKEED